MGNSNVSGDGNITSGDSLFIAPDFKHGLSGRDENGRYRTYTETQAREQGMDGYGMPMSEAGWGGGRVKDSKPQRNGATGSKKINTLVKNLDDVALDSGTTIYEFFEGVRNLAHQIGFQVDLGVADMKARAEHDAKKNGKWYLFGIDTKMTMRKVEKEAGRITDSLADAASGAIKTWMVINDEIIEPMLEAKGGKKKRPEAKTVAWDE